MVSRVCSTCREVKSIRNFGKKAKNPDGYRYACKFCERQTSIKYYRTLHGLLVKIYNKQIASSTRRGMVMPSYTSQELEDWVCGREYALAIYRSWVSSGYIKDMILSIDRLDDHKPYTLDNIQVTTWGLNNAKGYMHHKLGTNHKDHVAVRRLDLDGVYLDSFVSMSEAHRATGVCLDSISKCCNGRGKTAGGYIWQRC